jgi:organic hydroperoxide reductase OsmC/OhrA
MQPFPHIYRVSATLAGDGDSGVGAAGLPAIATGPPPEFGGVGDRWSPEMLLLAAVGDCFVLSFRAVSRASHFEFRHLECEVEGTLDRVGGFAQFTAFHTRARLMVGPGVDPERARKLLEKSEHLCLIARSLKGATRLDCEIIADPGSS